MVSVTVTPRNHDGFPMDIYVLSGRTGTMKLPLVA